ncbi:CASPASE_P20 domain-containing protein [Rubrivivax sp. A210]|uniref:caspase family protein n=1 Tax=Rubrivivax sp. A210 TaxID=2772301 RepID=UPI001918762E|nr:caspase family protein [Rubrivivax sp. A210]CAD5373269.1 CASPASE_P20 domain-containing protein [Rubrivivax sp. A210]
MNPLPSSLSRRHLLAAAAGSFVCPARAQAEAPRVAVVIGNAAYAGAPLANPVNDARLMTATLAGMGFEVVEARDASRTRMLEALAEAGRRLAGRQGTGLLYYAGHGLQVDWRNYMLPVDASPRSAAEVAAQALDVQAGLDVFRAAGCRMNIVVLDACRDNPFGASASGRGLAPVDAPPGSFLAYATAPGHLAEDGSVTDGNGLYTRHLAREMQRADARIEDVFKRVRLQVRQFSQGRQVPWESTSLEDDFVFATGRRADAAPEARRDADFDAEKAEWDRVKDSSRAADLYDFLQRHPGGRLAEQAQFRLDQLARPVVQPVLAVKALASGVARYRVGDAWTLERQDRQGGGTTRPHAEVTAIEGGRVLVNGGEIVLDQMGGILLNRFGAKDPALLVAPADMQVGKRWRTAFTNKQPGRPPGRSYYECRVTALEAVTVPAGRFRAFRVECSGEAIGPRGGGRRLQIKTWFDPATMTLVRHEVRQTSLDGATVLEDTIDQLVSRKLAQRD